MKEQFDNKPKDTTTIKSTPVDQSKPSKDELSEQELDKATGGAVDNFIWFEQPSVGPFIKKEYAWLACCTCSGLELALKRPSVPPPKGPLTEVLRTRNAHCDFYMDESRAPRRRPRGCEIAPTPS